jgi:hypothetical protein
MANPLEVIERKLAQQQTELDRAVSEMKSLMAAFDCDPVLDVEVSSFTDSVNAKREAAGLSPADRVTFAITESIHQALKLTGDFTDE